MTTPAPHEHRPRETTYQQVLVRLAELSALEDGWYDGTGQAPSEQDSALVGALVSLAMTLHVAAPRLYPMHNGGIRCEWRCGTRDVIAETVGERLDVLLIGSRPGEDAQHAGLRPEAVVALVAQLS